MAKGVKMYSAKELALYLLSLDKDKKIFNLNIATYNDRTFYEGNCRLNKMLQLAQNIYYAGTGERLIKEDMYAYDNGGVVLEIQEHYKELLSERDKTDVDIKDDHVIRILNDLFDGFGENTHIADVIRISHQDPEWQQKNKSYEREFKKMELSNMGGWYKTKMTNLARTIGGYDV